jgi:2-polyprenyl-6-methoxyphenol hydroxylase-like FAD-dependent oxidoreductase
MKTQCCIVGGGPAGMMLGLLLARAGIDVVVLEKHGDFLRDFRGDTVHPSTLEVMHELGILDEFLRRPHQEVRELGGQIGVERVMIADFTHLPSACRFVALMPQWEFLDFLAGHARRYPTFHVQMNAEVVDLIRDEADIVGVRATTPDGALEIHADLVVGADGRSSIVRGLAGLVVDDFGAPIDVLWMRLSRKSSDGEQTFGYIRDGHILVMLQRGDYWQCAFVIPKGGFDEIRGRGIEAFRATLASILPFMRDRVGEIRGWNDIKLLTVLVDRLRRWHIPGLLCIGDAAHAMSPIGGVGINLAIQDAVAAANLLAGPLGRGACSETDLARVQKRRELPTRLVQRAQLMAQKRLIGPALSGRGPQQLPWPLKLLRRFPLLRRIPARLVGMGIRPEHVRIADCGLRIAD